MAVSTLNVGGLVEMGCVKYTLDIKNVVPEKKNVKYLNNFYANDMLK